jgi:SAM-dependent methyltransferase
MREVRSAWDELKPVDFGRTAEDYGRYRCGFPPSFFNRIMDYGVGLPGQRLLDMGTGTGAMARGFARARAHVTGIDIAAPLLKEARRIDAQEGLLINYVESSAENTRLPSETFDVVAAGQCWHWFDRPLAAAESLRLLVVGGSVVIAHFDWLPLPGNLVEATETLIKKYNPSWNLGGGTGLYPAWLSDLSVAGFRDIETFSYDEQVVYTHVGWRGRIRASAGIGADLPEAMVDEFDQEHARVLASQFPEAHLNVPHRVFAVIGRKP